MTAKGVDTHNGLHNEERLRATGKRFNSCMHILYLIEKYEGKPRAHDLAAWIGASFSTFMRRLDMLREDFHVTIHAQREGKTGKSGATYTYSVTDWSFIKKESLMRYFDEYVYGDKELEWDATPEDPDN